MYCPNCGANISDKAVMCTYCNTFIDRTPTAENRTPAPRKVTAPPVRPSAPVRRAEKSGGAGLVVIGVLLIVLGIIGILMGMVMFGDIGIACMVGALSALFSGIGFLILDSRFKR